MKAGRKDLEALAISFGLTEQDFLEEVTRRFLGMPLVSRTLSRMGQSVSDAEGTELLRSGVPLEHLPYGNPATAWEIFGRWLRAFGDGEFRSKAVGEVLWRGRHI